MAVSQARSQADITAEHDRIKAESATCTICCGAGLVTVYHPTYRGEPIETTKDGRRYPALVAAHCRCSMGIWMRERTPEDIQARIPRVEDILTKRSRWLLNPPGERP